MQKDINFVNFGDTGSLTSKFWDTEMAEAMEESAFKAMSKLTKGKSITYRRPEPIVDGPDPMDNVEDRMRVQCPYCMSLIGMDEISLELVSEIGMLRETIEELENKLFIWEEFGGPEQGD